MSGVLIVLILQGVLGGFDSLVIHEIKEKLPQRIRAVTELRLHAAREFLYAIVFAGLAWFEWRGFYAWILGGVLILETAITAWDFVEEDLSRRLSALERVTHLFLSIGYGVVLALLAPVLVAWAQHDSRLVFVDHGPASWVLSFYALGVLAWCVRNLSAAARLRRRRAQTFACN